MSLALSCTCGSRFEVEETFAGQSVGCPDCHRLVRAPVGVRGCVRTSGYAIASVISALLLAVTVVGPVLAVALGVAALVSIARHRDRVTGAGFAVFGIVAGLVFTGIGLLASSQVELFHEARQTLLLGKVDRSGPLEVVREKDGFAITRPSPKWGVAGPRVLKNVQVNSRVLLVHPGKEAFLDVQVQHVGALGIDQAREQMVASFRHDHGDDVWGKQPGVLDATDFKLRASRRLPALGEAAVAEIVFDIRVLRQPVTFVIRLIKEGHTGRLFLVRGWVHRRHYAEVEPELRQAMNSFRLLGQAR